MEKPKLSAKELGQLDEHLQETLYLDAKSIVTYIEKTFNVSYGVRGVTELLKRLGFVYKKPKLIPGKSNPEAQKEFLQVYKTLKDHLNMMIKFYLWMVSILSTIPPQLILNLQ